MRTRQFHPETTCVQTHSKSLVGYHRSLTRPDGLTTTGGCDAVWGSAALNVESSSSLFRFFERERGFSREICLQSDRRILRMCTQFVTRQGDARQPQNKWKTSCLPCVCHSVRFAFFFQRQTKNSDCPRALPVYVCIIKWLDNDTEVAC